MMFNHQYYMLLSIVPCYMSGCRRVIGKCLGTESSVEGFEPDNMIMDLNAMRLGLSIVHCSCWLALASWSTLDHHFIWCFQHSLVLYCLIFL
jgi:hypothetical protein